MAPKFLGSTGTFERTTSRPTVPTSSGVFGVLVLWDGGPTTRHPQGLPKVGDVRVDFPMDNGHFVIHSGDLSNKLWDYIVGPAPGPSMPDWHLSIWSDVSRISLPAVSLGNSEEASVSVPTESGPGVVWGYVVAYGGYGDEEYINPHGQPRHRLGDTRKIDCASFSLDAPSLAHQSRGSTPPGITSSGTKPQLAQRESEQRSRKAPPGPLSA